MDKFPVKKIESIVTKCGVCLLAFITLVGILFVFDTVCELDIFPTQGGKDAFLILCLVVCVLILSCMLVATMLNISRIANSIESIAEHKSKPSAESHSTN